jgi:putative DNA-invertase from lambdoid prophage Rac
MRVALYCRVSTSDQDCDRQVADLTAFAERAGHEVVATFVETASGADNSRPERKKVLELARRREIGAILVTELSRWGRSTVDLVSTLDELHAQGVSIIAQTGLSFDLATPSGKLLRTLMAGLAEFERDLIKERVRSGMAGAKVKGTRSGKTIGRQVGFRPTDGKVGRVLKMRPEGYSLRSIAKHLRMSTMTVQQIIKRQSVPAAAA